MAECHGKKWGSLHVLGGARGTDGLGGALLDDTL